jgi:N4-gp56 family major capsid protein
VPDVYTSIATAGGWQTNTVKAAWDLLFRTALNPMPTCRQFVDVRPGRPTHTGDSITLQLTQNHSEATVTAAKTPLGEESDVSATQHPATTTITLTPTEYGFAEVSTLKLDNRSMVPLAPEKARVVADHCGKVVDELLQDQMILGTQVYRGSGRASTNLLTAGDALTSDMIRLGVTKLRANGALARDGIYYVGLVHPNVSYDLRKESGSGGWRVPQEYGQTQERIYKGEIGEWEGVRFVENARLRKANDGATSTTVYRSFLLGQEALAEAVVTEPGLRFGPVVDRLGRFVPVGWYGDFAFKIYRDLALVRFETVTAAS